MRFLFSTGKRILYAAVVLFAVIVLNFLLIHLAPGDAADTIASAMGGATNEIMAQIRHTYGLDKSIPEQLFIYFRKMLQGDLGYSFYFNTPVWNLILNRVPATILLVFSSQILSVFLGVFLGVIAALKPNGDSSVILSPFPLWSSGLHRSSGQG